MPQLNHPWFLDLGCYFVPHDQASSYLAVSAGAQVTLLVQGSQQIPRVLQHSWKPGLCSLFWGATPWHKSRPTPTSQGCITCLGSLASSMAAILGNSYSPPLGLPGTESGSRATSPSSPSPHLLSVGMSTGTPMGKGVPAALRLVPAGSSTRLA